MRLHRGGNRQLNSAFHRIAVTQIYMTRKLAEGKTKREAIRYLKRHLVRTIHTTMMTTTTHDAPPAALALT